MSTTITEERQALRKPISRKEQKPFRLEKKHIRSFLAQMAHEGKSEGTIRKYRTDLGRFYDFLNDDKWVYAHSLPHWRDSLLEGGYAGRSINASVVAINSFYDYLGCWEWKLFDWEELSDPKGPELTREEYRKLLTQARKQENIQLYLLIKILAQTELTPGDMSALTREAVNEGQVRLQKRGGERLVSLPEALCEELHSYGVYRCIRTGPLFLNASGNPLTRTAISRMISILGAEVGLESGKANPRNLRRMYLDTIAQLQRQADAWIRERYGALIRQEEEAIGWNIRQDRT